MSSPPLSTIIILSYNYARFLPAAIESALAQTLKDREIIVVDNGSTDETQDVVKPYLESIIYHRLDQNLGRAGGKNAGIAASRGKYIQFVDADDTILPEKLERSIKVFEDHPEADIVYCDSLFVNEDGLPMEDTTRWYRNRHFETRADVLDKLLQECFLLTHDGVIRRDAINSVGGFDDSVDLLEDWDFWLRLAAACKKFYHLPERLAVYNWHSTSITKNAAYSHLLRRNMIYKFVDDPEFRASIGERRHKSFLRYQHRALASSLYTLGRWRDSRNELMRSFKNGGLTSDPTGAGLYLKSLLRSVIRGA